MYFMKKRIYFIEMNVKQMWTLPILLVTESPGSIAEIIIWCYELLLPVQLNHQASIFFFQNFLSESDSNSFIKSLISCFPENKTGSFIKFCCKRHF